MTLTQSLQLASERLSAALNGGQALILALGIAAVMSLAGLQVAQGTMTIGDLVLANGLILQLSGPLQVLPLKSSWKLLCLWCFSDLCKFLSGSLLQWVAVLGVSVQRSQAVSGGPGESFYHPQVLCRFQPQPNSWCASNSMCPVACKILIRWISSNELVLCSSMLFSHVSLRGVSNTFGET